jgi:hypothetical protein
MVISTGYCGIERVAIPSGVLPKQQNFDIFLSLLGLERQDLMPIRITSRDKWRGKRN